MQTLNPNQAVTLCLHCGFNTEPNSRFCGGCGSLTPASGAVAPPVFARVQQNVSPQVSQELKEEAAKLLMQLARERILLLIHWSLFIGLNVIGCWLAIKCYNEFIGDEMSKIMIASTPFLFINSIALLCIVLIKGTRLEISKLKERISYVKFKIEFGHLI